MADLPLIPWDEVPEGHYVWALCGGSYRLMQRKGNELFEPGMSVGILPTMRLTPAEQQPGEWVVCSRCLSSSRPSDRQMCGPCIDTSDTKLMQSEADLTHLRDGLVALEQEKREKVKKLREAARTVVDGVVDYQVSCEADDLEAEADRLAALREGNVLSCDRKVGR